MDALPYDPLFEELINDYLEKGFAVSNKLFNKLEIDGLRELALKERSEENFRLAGVGDKFNFQKERSIRSDKILWLYRADAHDSEKIFFEKIDRFIQYLNLSCYAGILRSEFHYAIYDPGTFYERHSDQFKGDDSRRFSMVLYLTEDWNKGDGGELTLYMAASANGKVLIEPMSGRLVFFDSSIEHEVLLSKAQRISLTGWMRRR